MKRHDITPLFDAAPLVGGVTTPPWRSAGWQRALLAVLSAGRGADTGAGAKDAADGSDRGDAGRQDRCQNTCPRPGPGGAAT
jgi:hypothetical protein